MGYHVVRAAELAFEERPSPEGVQPRLAADVTVPGGLEQSRARVWRYPAGTRGRRHIEHAQEEVFVVLSGTLTLALGDPEELVQAGTHDVVAVHVDTPLQVRNDGDEELLVFVYGAPPVTGQAELLDS